MQFSDDQASAYDTISDALKRAGVDIDNATLLPESGKAQIFAVLGKAGSGKTMLLAKLGEARNKLNANTNRTNTMKWVRYWLIDGSLVFRESDDSIFRFAKVSVYLRDCH